MEHFYKMIEGFFDFEDVYRRAVEQAPDKAHFVEVGSWFGCSAAFLGVEIANSGKQIRLDLVDEWVDGFRYDACLRNLAPLKGAIDLRVTRARSVPTAATYPDASLDFVFIDADHSYENVKADVVAWLPKIRVGGVIAGHDHDSGTYPGVVRAVTELLPDARKTGRRSWWLRTPVPVDPPPLPPRRPG